MIDSITQTLIKVSTDGNAGPYIMVPVDQLDRIVDLLNANDFSHWVDSHAISIDGEPEIAVINLERGADAPLLQRLLDGAE